MNEMVEELVKLSRFHRYGEIDAEDYHIAFQTVMDNYGSDENMKALAEYLDRT